MIYLCLTEFPLQIGKLAVDALEVFSQLAVVVLQK